MYVCVYIYIYIWLLRICISTSKDRRACKLANTLQMHNSTLNETTTLIISNINSCIGYDCYSNILTVHTWRLIIWGRARQLIYIYIYICTHVYLSLSLSICIYIYIYTYFLPIYLSIYLYLSLYIYIYIYVSLCIYIYIYIYIWGLARQPWSRTLSVISTYCRRCLGWILY